MFKLNLRTNRLTDGSETYNVILVDYESEDAEKSRSAMQFHAVTHNDAMALMDGLKLLVQAHTVDEVTQRWG